MNRHRWRDFERKCQKPDADRLGNWMVRRISRPLALRVTWCVAPSGISASAVTCIAWCIAIGGIGALARGTVGGWLGAALLLQMWYLLDHVDGQLARWRRSASLDGQVLDYLMHHTIQFLIPCGLGWGVHAAGNADGWLAMGIGAGVAQLIIGLEHDTRARAVEQRLKRLDGRLWVHGGARQPVPAGPWPRSPRAWLGWTVRKSCEPHVQVNLITLVALVSWWQSRCLSWLSTALLVQIGASAAAVALRVTVRAQRQQLAEREFALWYSPPENHVLLEQDGTWRVVPCDQRLTAISLPNISPTEWLTVPASHIQPDSRS